MLRPILPLAVIGVLAVGCASESNAEPEAQTTVPTTSVATEPDSSASTSADIPTSTGALPDQLRAVRTDGFTIAVPLAWSVLLLGEGTMSTEQPDASISPSVEGLALAASMQGGHLLAVADDAASASLLVTGLGPDDQPPSAETSEAMRARLSESGVTDLTLEVVDLPAGPAVLSTYRRTAEGGAERHIATVYLPSPTTSWTVTLDTPVGAAEADLISEIANSFAPT